MADKYLAAGVVRANTRCRDRTLLEATHEVECATRLCTKQAAFARKENRDAHRASDVRDASRHTRRSCCCCCCDGKQNPFGRLCALASREQTQLKNQSLWWSFLARRNHVLQRLFIVGLLIASFL